MTTKVHIGLDVHKNSIVPAYALALGTAGSEPGGVAAGTEQELVRVDRSTDAPEPATLRGDESEGYGLAHR
jgi:hypothetical protein